jgi:DNA/RNA-binding domain of Phe-tRNA-synthetase-like protein
MDAVAPDNPMPLELAIHDSLSERVRLAGVVLGELRVRETSASLAEEVEIACRGLRDRYGGRTSGDIPEVAGARQLYKALGLDPTKTRPSSESLLRRALKSEPLYRINTLVDAVNLCSLTEQLPYGLYDLARVVPPVLLRLGVDGEGYEGIRKGFVHVAARPTLVDAVGPFGNPTSDSLRTSITLATQTALLVVYAPRRLARETMVRVAERTIECVLRHNGGRLVGQQLLPEGE